MDVSSFEWLNFRLVVELLQLKLGVRSKSRVYPVQVCRFISRTILPHLLPSMKRDVCAQFGCQYISTGE
jgi:hypothetical protein